MALKIIKTSDLEEISTCNDESFLTITQKISEDNFISNKMQIKNLPLNNYYKKADIDELLKTYSKTTHNHDFNSLSNLPTTLSGYGITDVYTKTESDDKYILKTHSHNYLSLTGGLLTGNLKFDEVDGHGINFYNSDIYSIYMSSANNSTYGGRLWESTSDYNMYFKMQSGTNRGFVFKNGDTVLGGMDGSGVFRALKMISTKDIYFGSGTTTDIGYFKDGELTFSNCKGIYGKGTNGEIQRLVVVGSDNSEYFGSSTNHTYIRSSDCPQYLDSNENKYDIYHSGNFNPSNYFSRSGQNTTNLNTCYDVGIYFYTDSTTGAPNKQYGHILNTVSSGNKYNGSTNWLSQLAFNTDDTIWHRSKVNSGGWTNWTKLVKTTDLNNYLPKSGGTMTGALALTQDKGIVSANSEGGTLLVETSSSVNVGKTIKAVNLNCSVGSVNGSMILTTANHMFHMKNVFHVLFERNNGTINKNINTCFNSTNGEFTAPSAGQYLVMCSGYKLSTSDSMYIACVVGYERSNRNELYRTGSSGFTLITLSEKETLQVYKCPAGNVTTECISANSLVNMLIAKID